IFVGDRRTTEPSRGRHVRGMVPHESVVPRPSSMSAPDRDTIARRFKAACLRALPLMIGGGLVAASFLPGSTALGRDESGMFDVLLGRRPAPAFRPAPAMFE